VLRSWIRRLCFALALVALPQAAYAQFTVTRTSSPIFYNDAPNTPSLTCMYASYRVTNTSGTTVNDVWVDIGHFTGGLVTLAPTEPGVRHLGPMGAGASRMVYFYLYAPGTTGTTQSHAIHVYSSRPPAAPLVTQTFNIASVQNTIKANANKVTTVVSGPTPPHVGGIVTITVTGSTGTIGSPLFLAFTPASDINWRADA